jgi:heat shock protein HslJ
MKRNLLILSLIIGLFSISGKKEAEFVKNWHLKTMNNIDVTANCNMRINPNGQFIGKGICNNFTGNFMFDGKKKVKVNQNIMSTKMFCKETQELENEFFATLKKVDGYEVDDDILYLKAQKVTVLTFTKVIEPKEGKKKKNK